MKVKIWCDEWYPVYTLEEDYGDEHDIPVELVKRYRIAHAQWRAVQDKLDAIYQAPYEVTE